MSALPFVNLLAPPSPTGLSFDERAVVLRRHHEGHRLHMVALMVESANRLSLGRACSQLFDVQ